MERTAIEPDPDGLPSHTPTSLLSLPKELLHLILESVEAFELPMWETVDQSYTSNDIRSCSLTCKQLRSVACRMLIRHVSLTVSVKSLSHFEQIMAHPSFSKGVQDIDIVLSCYCPQLSGSFCSFVSAQIDRLEHTIDNYYSPYSFGEPDEVDTARLQGLCRFFQIWCRILDWRKWDYQLLLSEEESSHFTQLYVAHELYSKLYHEQQRLMDSEEFVRRLASSAAKMARVQILRFHGPTLCPPKDFPAWDYQTQGISGPIRDAMLDPLDWHHGTALEDLMREDCRVVPCTPLALFEAGAMLENAYIDLRRKHLGSVSSMVPTPAQNHRLSVVMPKLRSFTMSCPASQFEDVVSMDSDAQTDEQALANICRPWFEAPNLEEVHIDAWLRTETAEIHDVTQLLKSSRISRKLTSITLRGQISIHVSGLKSFIGRFVRPNRPKLILVNMGLLSGTWTEALRVLRAGNLRELGLEGPRGNDIALLNASLAGEVTPWARERAEEFFRVPDGSNFVSYSSLDCRYGIVLQEQYT